MSLAAAGVVALAAQPAFAEPKAEVMHWWTSGGEAAAAKVLKEEFAANGGTWTDMAVAGGGGDAAITALKARVLAGNPPTAFQMKGPSIQEWFEEGVLANIDDVAQENGWDAALPARIAAHMKCDGKYCAAPVNIHRVNWVWANPQVLAKVGAAMPHTWAEFNAVADKLKAAGITPLAHGGQSWQDATVFETVVLGIGGAEFFQKAFVDLDEAALSSDTMKASFDQMRILRGYVDDNFSGRDWNLATAMVMKGEAGFQIMGDWAKGEFIAAGKKPGKDFMCAPTPGSGFLYNVDSFAMFDVKGEDNIAGEKLLAKLIMGPKFQEVFNLNKGSIPVRTDVSLEKFDYCAQRSAYDLAVADGNGTLQPSYAHGMALRGAQAGAITDVVTKHFNSDMSSEDAVKALVEAVKLSQ
ncbi:MAG: sugar ABC transporter substrate-binding protein [Hyphomicrobiales bacterium]|nr:MAG: sugar ABC transporter substrate-binding protein [Hyphomicrobiales bacterium]